VTLLSHSNHWYVNRARLLLQQRAAAGTLQSGTRESLTRALGESKEEVHQLNLLWAIHATGGLKPETVIEQLSAPAEFVRAWAIQLGLDGGTPLRALVEKLAVMARNDVSPVVRLYLASALQRLSAAERIPIAEGLLAHPEDSADPNLPSLIWFGIEPLVSANNDAARQFLMAAKIPLVRQFIAKRLGLRLSLNTPSAVLAQSSDPALQSDIIHGLFEALNGRREIPMPSAWPAVVRTASRHSDAQVRDRVLLLSAVFGQREALEQLQSILTKPGEPVARRQTALQALVQAKAPGLLGTLQTLVRDASLRAVAIRGLAAFDDVSTPRLVLEQYASLTPGEKADAINTLASRPQYAVALLEAVKSGVVPSKDVSPFAARQILALKDDRLPAMLSGALGNIRSLSREKAGQIARYKAMLGPEALRQADLSAGRAVFERSCAACHTLFGTGGTLAPELTGSQRSNLDYVLENVVDPNAVVWNRYRASYFETRDDRLISGVVLQENESTVTIQTQTETVTLPRGDIVSREESTLSMMPEGLLESLTEKEVVDFVAYLQSPAQVPLPGGVK
jgi:putative heme-binding domain-containing protein